MSRGTRNRRWQAGAALAFAAIIGAAVLVLGTSSRATRQATAAAVPSGPSPASVAAERRPRFRLDADHATYATVPEIAAAADTIVNGQVVSETTEPGESPGVDALGDPLPAIPHTDHAIVVATTLKGTVAPGSTIHVTVAGGDTAEGEYVLEGAPQIGDGESALFFLVTGEDGRYYPLAGGAAVATRLADGSFALPADATGGAPRSVSEDEVKAAVGATPSSGGGNGGGGGRAVTPAPVPHPFHCRKGTKKKKAKGGRLRCVKRHHHHKHHRRVKHHGHR
jgi:hypothetical protein